MLCDLCSKYPVEFFAETMSQPVVSLQLVGLALMRASLQIRASKCLTVAEISELETRCFVLSIPVCERVWYSWIEMITDGGVTTRIVPGFLDALHHPSTTISCRVNCDFVRRLVVVYLTHHHLDGVYGGGHCMDIAIEHFKYVSFRPSRGHPH